jgi:hypothetical protein
MSHKIAHYWLDFLGWRSINGAEQKHFGTGAQEHRHDAEKTARQPCILHQPPSLSVEPVML